MLRRARVLTLTDVVASLPVPPSTRSSAQSSDHVHVDDRTVRGASLAALSGYLQVSGDETVPDGAPFTTKRNANAIQTLKMSQ